MKEIFAFLMYQTSVFEKVFFLVVFVLLVYVIIERLNEMKKEDFDGRDN